ncbi:MAG: DNA polymerase III subunit delta' [Chloroflexi bacterium]|nr:DNA polymerase III subunit delta' [Chloroflexota bacterium]
MTDSLTNWGIIGHEWAVAFLRRSIAGDRMAHAYVIGGPEGIGKALLALRLAQALNCDRAGVDPCLQCRACQRIAHGNHPDVRVVGMATQAAGLKPDEAARQKELRIDTVREWQRDVTLKPYEGRRRIFILHDAERLTEAASNALLKTLEEPPPYATLILVAHTAGSLLPTIVSRCQLLRLRPVPRAQVAAALREMRGLIAGDAELLAAWSGGRIGWALRMADAPEELEARQEQLAALLSLAEQPIAARLRWAEERAKEYRAGEQAAVMDMLALWQSWWRDVLLTAAGCPQAIVHIDRRDEVTTAASHYAVADVHAFLTSIGLTVQRLRDNVNPQLAIEGTLLALPERRGVRR